MYQFNLTMKNKIKQMALNGYFQIGGEAYMELLHCNLDKLDLKVFFDKFDVIDGLIDLRDRCVIVIVTEHNNIKYQFTVGIIGDLLWLYSVNRADKINSSFNRLISI